MKSTVRSYDKDIEKSRADSAAHSKASYDKDRMKSTVRSKLHYDKDIEKSRADSATCSKASYEKDPESGQKYPRFIIIRMLKRAEQAVLKALGLTMRKTLRQVALVRDKCM